MSRLTAAAARAKLVGPGLALALALASCGWFGINQRPHAAFSYSLSSPLAPSVLTLDGAGSHDPDGEVVSYLWSVNGEHHGGKVAVVPVASAGTYQVRLIVTDDRGAIASTSATFHLDLAPPTASGPEPASLVLHASTSQSASANLNMSNSGGADLEVALSSNVGWLSVAPATAVLASLESAVLTVTASCGANETTHQSALQLATNDPSRPVIEIPVTLVCGAAGGPTSEFQITLLFSGEGMTEQRRQTFIAAAERWSEVIIGDLPSVEVTQAHVTNCDSGGGFVTPGLVDDILMLVSIRAIDGPGKILGQAGVCWRRSGALGLPVVGRMTLDVADVTQLESEGRFTGVILHEMGHLLDLNSSGWSRHGLLAHDGASCSSSSEIHFIGANAASEWLALGATGPLPVEEDGGAGTMCSHWDETRLGSELMTGWASGAMELSKVTIGALDDLGYQVDYGAADPYTPPSGLTEAALDAFEINEVLLPELGTIDPVEGTQPGDRR